jgi:hypothetical protein
MLHHLITQAEEYEQDKQDYGPGPVSEYAFTTSECLLQLPPNLDSVLLTGKMYESLPLTEHALRQVCGRLGPAAYDYGSTRSLPFEYMRACPPHLRATNLNHWIPKVPEGREWFVRRYEDNIRAVLTNRYSVVDTLETLKWVQQIIDERGNGGIDVARAYLTPDTLGLDVFMGNIDPGGIGGPYRTGVRVGTGEIGNRRISVAPYVQRTACTNSIVWQGQGYWAHPHTGRTRVLRQQFLVAMVGAFEGTEPLLEKLLEAENKDLPNFDKILDDMCERQSWGQEVRDNVIRGSEQQNTVWGFVNGLTYASQHLGDEEERDATDMLAGEFLRAMTNEPAYSLISRGDVRVGR